jgi:hypothetical protein
VTASSYASGRADPGARLCFSAFGSRAGRSGACRRLWPSPAREQATRIPRRLAPRLGDRRVRSGRHPRLAALRAEHTRSSPPAGVTLAGGPHPPAAEKFSRPRAYAEAMTRYLLTSGQTLVLGRPHCGDRVTWTSWVCRAPGRSGSPPNAGRTFSLSMPSDLHRATERPTHLRQFHVRPRQQRPVSQIVLNCSNGCLQLAQ